MTHQMPNRSQFFFLFVLLSLLCTFTKAQVCKNVDGGTVCAAVDEDADKMRDEFELADTLQDLMDWIRKKGGFIHPSLGVGSTLIKYNEFDRPTYKFGIYVEDNEESIAEGETLLSLPPSIMIQVPRQGDFDEDTACLLGDRLAFERYHKREKEEAEENGEGNGNAKGSAYGPYIEFLEGYVIDHTNLPATWSYTGRSILGGLFKDDAFFHSNFQEFYRCFQFDLFGEGNDNRHDEDEMMEDVDYWGELIEVSLARGLPHHKLVPIFDLIQHSNDPQQMNVQLKSAVSKTTSSANWEVVASRDLQAKDELKLSYYTTGQEGLTKNTKELFHNHGIVEDYPQRWTWDAYKVDVSLVRTSAAADGQSELELKWHSSDLPDDDAIYHFEVQLHFYKQWYDHIVPIAIDSDEDDDEVSLPAHEKKLMLQYIDSHLTAIRMLIDSAERRRQAFANETQYQVHEEKYVMDNVDSRLFNQYQCNTLIQRIFDGDFDTIEKVRSAYQQITYYRDPDTDDVCLYLDGVYQQCVSYWPHYHELVVHKPAKYLKEDLKRVLWVGGGDSGPLNEFLKYPTLELAVGLELDQQVTRSAFKHFASRPHYDNPKVQWWYGDASKSLLMLPEDYFGSFDLVIVDLSDTVFSLSVSAELDVIEAISLLLRPGGIFEMNELFFKKVSNVFEYAVHYQFSDVPKICDQAAIFASNDVDFMYQELTEHTLVENATLLVEKDSMLTKHQFDRVHDYRHNPNPAFKKLCKKVQDEDDQKEVEKPQSTAPGIMMIVEAENLTADLSSPAFVRTSITGAIEKVGLTVVSEKSSSVEAAWFVIMMEEGYVVVRVWSEENYCALDLHLWSSFDSHEGLKEAIVVGALGGDLMNKSTSSYRIVAGGMFGLSDWKEELKKHGPQLDGICSEDEQPERNDVSPKEVKQQALELSLEVLQGSGLTAIVLCGTKDAECATLNTVKVGDKFDQVIPIYDAAPKTRDNAMRLTIDEAREKLDEELPGEKDYIHAIFFDDNSSDLSTFVFQMIGEEGHVNFEDLFAVGTTDSKSEIWRRQYLNFIREDIEMDPVFRGLVLLNTTSSTLELSITASGDSRFMEHLTEAVSSSQAKISAVTLENRNIVGGFWRDGKQHLCEDDEFSQVTVEEDYNHDDARAQWASQTALATQTLLQFSNSVDGTPTILNKDDLVKACIGAFASRIGASMNVYDDLGGDGAICAGTWETGTAVVSWDGRYQVDLNIFSTLDLKELQAFEKDMKMRLSNLGGWLRDIQPRGYGRVVTFKESMMSTTSSFFSDGNK